MVLQGLNDAAYKVALAAVPTLKTGRPTVTDKPLATKPAAKPAAKRVAKPATKAVTKPAAPVVAQPVAKPTAKKAAAKKSASAPEVAAKRPVVRRTAPAKKAD